MSTLRITNIEAKADPSSPTVDEKIKLTNSNGDILVHIDGKTSGITTIGINTTAGNIKFDQNSNVVVTGIITATKFVGTIEPTTLTVGGDLTIPDKIVHTGDTNTALRFPAADTFTVETAGSERVRVSSTGKFGIGTNNPDDVLTISGTDAFIKVDRSNGNPGIDFRYNGSTTNRGLIDVTSTGDLRLAAGGNTERLRITSEGHIKHTGLRNGNSENKLVYYTVPSHDTGEEDVIIFTVANESSSNQITFGGGPSAYNAATEILFRTASAVDTTVGSERLKITSNGMVRVTDSASLTFGNNDDMRIFHDGGSANYIDVYNKDLYIRCNRDSGITGGDIVLQPKSGENSAIFRDNGAVELYYDNSKKFETTTTGASITDQLTIGSGSAANSSYGLIAYSNSSSLSNRSAVYARNLNSGGRTFTGDNDTGATTFEVYGNGTIVTSDNIHLNSTDKKIYLTSDYDQYITANAASNYMAFAAGNAERLRIDSDGRVLIGTTSAMSSNSNAKLQIRSTSDAAQIILGRNDTTATTGESIGYLSFQGNDGGSFQECARIAAVVDANHANNDKPTRISFYVCRDNSGSISESWRLRSDGGTQNFSTSTNYDLSNTRSAGNTYEFFYARNNAGSLGAGTLAFKVTNNGNVSNTNNSYGSLSDQRLKENIVDATSQWDDIKGLQIRKYNFRENTGYETHTQIGLIAQEAESISPGLVETSAVKEGETVLDADGNQLDSIKSINYSVLYMKSVKALQEAQTRIETLETQLTDALARITALEG